MSQREDRMQEWIEAEARAVDWGDERLDRRYQVVLDQLSQKPSVSIPAACGGWAETIAAYRFLDHERVDEQKVLKPQVEATRQRIGQEAVVLLVQDTTEIDVTRRQERMDGAGPLSDDSRVGFFNHALLAVTPPRVALGVVAADIWARGPAETSQSGQRKQKPIEEKES
jgi:beta-glucosidase-like glycosyl hydrolase